MRVQAFGFEKKLVHFLIRKLYDFVFDRGAVTRADGLNLSAVHGRAVNVLADNAVRLRRGVRDVAGHLRIVMGYAPGAEAERSGIGVARLLRETRPVDGASVEARRSAGLEAASAQAELFQSLAEQDGVGLTGASRGILLFAAVDETVEECSGGDDHGRCADGAAVSKLNANDPTSSVGGFRFSVFGCRSLASRF